MVMMLAMVTNILIVKMIQSCCQQGEGAHYVNISFI